MLLGASSSDEMDANTNKFLYQMTRAMAANMGLLYMDESLRIKRNHSGIVYIFSRTQDVGNKRFESRFSGIGATGTGLMITYLPCSACTNINEFLVFGATNLPRDTSSNPIECKNRRKGLITVDMRSHDYLFLLAPKIR
jgi:hypothetical protein